MAVATFTPTITDSWYDGKRLNVVGTLAVSNSADTYATGGAVCSFAGKVLSAKIPTVMQVKGNAGYDYNYIPGTDLTNGKIKINIEATVATNTPLAEFGNGAAVGAAMAADVINFEAIFKLR